MISVQAVVSNWWPRSHSWSTRWYFAAPPPPTWHQSVMLVRPLPSLPWHCPCPGCFFFFTYKLSYLRFMTAFSKKKKWHQMQGKDILSPSPSYLFPNLLSRERLPMTAANFKTEFFIYLCIYLWWLFFKKNLAQGHADMLRCSRNPTSLPIPKTCWGVCKVPASWERGPGR